MILKTKILKLSAGIPIALLNEKDAKELGVHVGERILLCNSSPKKNFSATVDITNKIVKKNQVGISIELQKILQAKESTKLQAILSPVPHSITLIKRKLSGKKLSSKQIYEIIKDVVDNKLSEPEIALFIAAMYQKGMSKKETISLVKAILETGSKLNLKEKVIVDKHSIGGIAGNRTTPIVVAICTAAGLKMPKTSSRAITSAAGTADVIETIAKIDFPMKEIKKIVNKTGGCLVWGGGLGMVPADSKIIKVEKLLKIDPRAQLLASIMAKKLAVGSTHILIDIPYGKTAKVTKQKAIELEKDFRQLGEAFHRKMVVLLTPGEEPMGDGVGPALEIRDVIRVLNPKKEGPADLEQKSLLLAGALLELTKKAKRKKGIELAKQLLESGKAFEKFKQIIEAQGGKVKEPKLGKYKKDIFSKRSGTIKEIDNKKINSLARQAGCPEDQLAGLDIAVGVRQKIKKGDKIMTIYSQSKPRLNSAINFLKKKKPITFN
jgi:putative thymidine phosphorylase